MNILTQAPSESSITSSVIALHCSLSSGHQWSRLTEELTGKHQVITPDISGYGNNDVCWCGKRWIRTPTRHCE